ncbi:MAG: substrate-binding domain-containing protein, partial [Geothrix sp.]|nr:substrate-binding domain-containing protein [Geothrix sp.]
MGFRVALIAVLLSGCCLWAQGAPPASKTITICSYEMEPLLLRWEDALRTLDPHFKLDLRPNSAAEVAKALIDGRSRLAPINRELKPEEIAAFSAKWGYPPTRLAVGADALVILVPKVNPIKELRIDQLDAIWTTTRRSGYPKDIATWGDLGLHNGKWARRPIVCMDRPEGDGLKDYFREYVSRGGQDKDSIHRSSDAMALIEELGSNEAAISYGGLGEVLNNLRAVPLLPPGGKTAVKPSLESVSSGEYPLTRIVYVYFNRAPNRPIDPAIQEFLRFVIS